MAASSATKLSKDALEFVPGQVPVVPQQQASQTDPQSFESLLRGGYWSRDLGWWVPYYTGKLKSFNVRNGFGFLESQQTWNIYKADVYIHKSQVPMPWKIGQHVEFAVSQNSRGQPQAQDVNWIPFHLQPPPAGRPTAAASAAAPGSMQQAHVTNTVSPTGGQAEPATGTPIVPDVLSAPPSSAGARYIGMLKSYSTTQGYGFITSDEIQEKHSCDVYLDRGQLPTGEWRPGQVVEFEVGYNGRGQPQARAVNWDPVPMLPRPSSAGGPPAMSRALDSTMTRNISKVLSYLRDGDKSQAVKAAVELAGTTNSAGGPTDVGVDYVSFALARIGSPSPELAAELGKTGVDSMALISLSELLMRLGEHMDTTRTREALAWCEALARGLRRSSAAAAAAGTATGKFDHVIQLVSGNIATAAANVQDRTAHDAVLAALRAGGEDAYA